MVNNLVANEQVSVTVLNSAYFFSFMEYRKYPEYHARCIY